MGVAYWFRLGAATDIAHVADVHPRQLVYRADEPVDDVDDWVDDSGRRVLDTLPKLTPPSGKLLEAEDNPSGGTEEQQYLVEMLLDEVDGGRGLFPDTALVFQEGLRPRLPPSLSAQRDRMRPRSHHHAVSSH